MQHFTDRYIGLQFSTLLPRRALPSCIAYLSWLALAGVSEYIKPVKMVPRCSRVTSSSAAIDLWRGAVHPLESKIHFMSAFGLLKTAVAEMYELIGQITIGRRWAVQQAALG